MTSRYLTAVVLALAFIPLACGDDSQVVGPPGPPGPYEYVLLGSWMITIPPEYEVSMGHSMYDGRTFTAFRQEGNISVRSANTDAPLPDFETLDDPLTLADHSWYQIDTVENTIGGMNALYSIQQLPDPPVRTVALLIGEKTRGLEWGKYTIVALVAYDEGYLGDVLELTRSVRQAPAE